MNKKLFRRLLALALALCLVFSLSACGNTDDVTGDDWRASGDVAGSGTITHDGESDVLVSFIHENGDETELMGPPAHYRPLRPYHP